MGTSTVSSRRRLELGQASDRSTVLHQQMSRDNDFPGGGGPPAGRKQAGEGRSATARPTGGRCPARGAEAPGSRCEPPCHLGGSRRARRSGHGPGSTPAHAGLAGCSGLCSPVLPTPTPGPDGRGTRHPGHSPLESTGHDQAAGTPTRGQHLTLRKPDETPGSLSSAAKGHRWFSAAAARGGQRQGHANHGCQTGPCGPCMRRQVDARRVPAGPSQGQQVDVRQVPTVPAQGGRWTKTGPCGPSARTAGGCETSPHGPCTRRQVDMRRVPTDPTRGQPVAASPERPVTAASGLRHSARLHKAVAEEPEHRRFPSPARGLAPEHPLAAPEPGLNPQPRLPWPQASDRRSRPWCGHGPGLSASPTPRAGSWGHPTHLKLIPSQPRSLEPPGQDVRLSDLEP